MAIDDYFETMHSNDEPKQWEQFVSNNSWKAIEDDPNDSSITLPQLNKEWLTPEESENRKLIEEQENLKSQDLPSPHNEDITQKLSSELDRYNQHGSTSPHT